MKSEFYKIDTPLTATLINARNGTDPEIVLPPGSIIHAAERIAKCISFRASSDGSHFEWMYAQVDAFLTAAPLVVIKEDSHLTTISKRAGVAAGSDAQWTDASSAADALRRFLNDDMSL